MAKIQKKSKQQFHLIPFFYFPPKDCPSGGQLSPLGFAACQSKNCSNRAVHAPTLQFSHRTRRTHRTFWQIRASHRLHRLTQIRRVWHPCHTHAAAQTIFPQNSRNTETTGGEYPPTDCTDMHRLGGYGIPAIPTQPPNYLPTEFTEHTETTGGEEKSVYICEIRGRLFSARSFCVFCEIRGRTLRSLTICVHLCASVGGYSPPEASVYPVQSVGEYPPPEISVNSVNSVGGPVQAKILCASVKSVGGLAQTNLEWVLWKEFGGQRGYGRDAIPYYENSHRLYGCAQIRRQKRNLKNCGHPQSVGGL